jgi:hypothetical protein
MTAHRESLLCALPLRTGATVEAVGVFFSAIQVDKSEKTFTISFSMIEAAPCIWDPSNVSIDESRADNKREQSTMLSPLPPIHRKTLRSLEETATPFHLSLHLFTLYQQLIREVAVEDDAL